ncbi:MAG: 2-oxoacid:ferredoxin oxidoreductase subunit beta [Thermodesulfobacteriota bacterium]|nr:2-oxoacid:ferredoxin oxidoreductase subunit beta [Thermodesulfobacteriota bacterium]
MVTLKDYEGSTEIAWCPGCGNFAILQSLKKALVTLKIEPHQILFVSGIGQAPKLPHYTHGNIFNGLHGRSIPVATGAKIANHELVVIVIDGDGGAYGEGVGHLLAAMRRNVRMTYLVHNNQVYGLTKGQASPTSDLGYVTKTTPLGAGQSINPAALAIASDVSFFARGFAGDIEHLSGLLEMGITHHGFALIDILQPCVSFNHKNTYQWYRDRVYKVEEENGYDPSDKATAFMKAQEWEDRIPLGVIYKRERPLFEKQLPLIQEMTLVQQPSNPNQFEELLDEFM